MTLTIEHQQLGTLEISKIKLFQIGHLWVACMVMSHLLSP